jgi:rhodanese-related sulfurtransferase
MFTDKSSKLMLILLLSLAMMISACGGGPETPAPAEEAAPLAALEEAAPVEEAAPAKVAEAVEEETAFDLVAAADAYLSALPEGYLAVGKIEAVKEILATGEARLIDVREAGEYAEGHLPGAINIPLRTLAQNLDKIPVDKPVLVYCKSGLRAGMATSTLHMLGYHNVRTFPPGFTGWAEAGETVEMEPVAATTYEVPEIEPELLAAVDGFLSEIPEGFLAVSDIEKLNEAIANGAFLIDVREESEYMEGHLPKALNVPIRSLAQNLDKVPADRPVFVYCKSGQRAALSTAVLQALGYTNVRAFPPGFEGWSAAGQPVAALQ